MADFERGQSDYTDLAQQGHIAYGLQPGLPQPDVNMATTAFIGPVLIEPHGDIFGVRQRAARWLDRHREAMKRLADL